MEPVQPLHGVRVLEFGQFAAGPFAGNILADWGADVVKIEAPGGDGLRNWPPFARGPDGQPFSLNFASVSRNKRSLTADFSRATDIHRLLKLISVADVVIENFRPGVLARFGLGFEDVRELSDKLVYCSVNGYGSEGPYRDRGAFDIAIQGISGLMSITGEANGPPAKAGVPVADFISALYAAIGVLVGREQAARTRKSVYVECSMLSCMLAVSALQTSEYWGTGKAPMRMGSAHPRNAPYQAFRGADGRYFIIAAGNDRLYERLCKEVLKVEALAFDSRFESQIARVEHQEELAKEIQSILDGHDAAYWLEACDRAGVPCAPVLDYGQALTDPHVLASNLIHSMPLPNGGSVPTVGNPVRMTDYTFHVYRHPPFTGEHSADIVDEWLGDA